MNVARHAQDNTSTLVPATAARLWWFRSTVSKKILKIWYDLRKKIQSMASNLTFGCLGYLGDEILPSYSKHYTYQNETTSITESRSFLFVAHLILAGHMCIGWVDSPVVGHGQGFVFCQIIVLLAALKGRTARHKSQGALGCCYMRGAWVQVLRFGTLQGSSTISPQTGGDCGGYGLLVPWRVCIF